MRRAVSEFEAKRKGYQVTALTGAAQLNGNKQEAVAGLKTSATALSHEHDTQPETNVADARYLLRSKLIPVSNEQSVLYFGGLRPLLVHSRCRRSCVSIPISVEASIRFIGGPAYAGA
jgi:hypothetical protein